jgi:hypothetical protein
VGSTRRTLFAVMLGLIAAGCGATGTANHTAAGSPTAQASVAPASSFADLRSRPLNQPALAADGTCPITPSHDLHPVVTVGKGGPGFGFGPGPAYLSGIVQLYPGAFDNEVWMIDATYRGPVLVRSGHAVSFQEPITFPGGGFSSAGPPPPNPAVASVTIDGTPIAFYSELDLPAADPSYPTNSWRLFFARTHIDAPGCYAFQLDGLTFSVVIVFVVPDAARPGG